MARQIKEGTGWRLGWDADAPQFQGLVGGEGWAIELTEAEWDDFCRLSVQLADTMQQMSQELMDEERLSCEVESDRLWLEAEGYPHAFSLQLILLTGRRAEGFWPATVVPELIRAAQMLKVF
ncbi:MAG: DUF1818 family protein [Oculatellaceae cyanobacterium Prado106]|jgi:hypothetical protein|nr:DUF1818 family protein [Oculatellaceae cyanobacterium Prado106]